MAFQMLAGGEGFEPPSAESESAVLPLDDPPSSPTNFLEGTPNRCELTLSAQNKDSVPPSSAIAAVPQARQNATKILEQSNVESTVKN